MHTYTAILFCHPHPYDDKSLALFVQSTDPSGLERAVRLFPIRTGVLSPDWLVVNGRADTIGAAGVQGAGYASPLFSFLFFFLTCASYISVYGWKPNTGSQDVTNEWQWNERMSWLD